jgi:hypothetical protein
MNDLLLTLDTDIKKCEETLRLNNYLEIVIVIEETIDKYKDKIDGINIDSDRIWNYSKKDLENILNKLRIEKEKIINEYIQTNIKTINNIDNVYYSIKNEIEDNKDLSDNKKNDNLAILEDIYNIGKDNKTKQEKWENLKSYIIKVSDKEVYIASKIILLIYTILDN